MLTHSGQHGAESDAMCIGACQGVCLCEQCSHLTCFSIPLPGLLSHLIGSAHGFLPACGLLCLHGL